jgi:hypothetical protein
MYQDREGGPVHACRRCRDPARRTERSDDGRRAGSEQGTAAPATALASRGRPPSTRTAGEPGRCARTAKAGRGKPVGDAVIRRWRTVRSDDGRRAGSEQGTAASATALAPRVRPPGTLHAGEPGRCARTAKAGRGKPIGDAVIRQGGPCEAMTAEGPAASKGPPRRPLPSPLRAIRPIGSLARQGVATCGPEGPCGCKRAGPGHCAGRHARRGRPVARATPREMVLLEGRSPPAI